MNQVHASQANPIMGLAIAGIALLVGGLVLGGKKGEGKPAPTAPGDSQLGVNASFLGTTTLLQPAQAVLNDIRTIAGNRHTFAGHPHKLIQTVVNGSTDQFGTPMSAFFTINFEVHQGSNIPGRTGRLLQTLTVQRRLGPGITTPIEVSFTPKEEGGDPERDVRVRILSSEGQQIAERLQQKVFWVDPTQIAFNASFLGSTTLLQHSRIGRVSRR